MLRELNSLRLTPETAYEPLRLNACISTALGVDINRIRQVDIVKRSIDARQRQVMVNLSVRVHLDEITPVDDSATAPLPTLTPEVPQAIVVGAGPAGLFASLELIRNGVRPIMLERGKDVDSRRADMAAIAREGRVDPDSNYCFGEGGAGAFSDGKLYTRSKKRGPVDEILKTLVANGAAPEILAEAHPHIGSDRLPGVIKSIRESIIAHGGEVHFGTAMVSLNIATAPDGSRRVTGVTDRNGRIWDGPVILATGHSARDLYRTLDAQGVEMEPKGLAVGVRLEHPQKLIDSIMYHSPAGRGKYLPAAEYTMLTRVDGRAVYSFCMCPGGVVIPSASAPGESAVNGMSASARSSRWANSGMVVEVLPEDVDGDDALKMLRYQEELERRFFEDAGQTQKAPAQRMTDFVAGKPSKDLPDSSYAPGVYPARVDRLLYGPIAGRLRKGFEEFGRKSRGFLTRDAIVLGAETRTSSPLRIPRDREKMHHTHIAGLYPAGEGAGWAGGIVSAAIDGQNAARALATSYGK